MEDNEKNNNQPETSQTLEKNNNVKNSTLLTHSSNPKNWDLDQDGRAFRDNSKINTGPNR